MSDHAPCGAWRTQGPVCGDWSTLRAKCGAGDAEGSGTARLPGGSRGDPPPSGSWNEAGRVVPKKDGTQMAPSSLKSQWWNWAALQKIDPHLPIHGLRDSFGTWVYETYGVKQAQEWLGHSDPATTLRHYVRLTTAARAKAVAGLDEVTRAALEIAERRAAADAEPALDNVVSLASGRR